MATAEQLDLKIGDPVVIKELGYRGRVVDFSRAGNPLLRPTLPGNECFRLPDGSIWPVVEIPWDLIQLLTKQGEQPVSLLHHNYNGFGPANARQQRRLLEFGLKGEQSQVA